MRFKIVLVISLIFLIGFVFADSLEQVKIKSVVPLNENLTISGNYVTANENAGILCSFKIFDVQTTEKYLIERLSDEYTFSDGSFSSKIKITEPLFQRGFDYNVVVCCASVCFDQNFYVDQKDDMAFGINAGSLTMDLAFWTDPENSFTAFWMLVIILMASYFIFRILGQSN